RLLTLRLNYTRLKWVTLNIYLLINLLPYLTFAREYAQNGMKLSIIRACFHNNYTIRKKT
ncbi:hypothetical protein, partial [Lentimicrobium sp. L6]|uniref:hypothetical protein n=1 Tax=Lentimicrobium sp. L6 TaxID=2735916 RepID=UPI001C12CFC5